MFRNSLSWYILTLTLLDFIIKTHPTLHDSSHGFIGKSSRYFDDDFAHLHEEISSLVTGISDIALNLQLKFEPSSLDFKQRPLGIPHLEKVTLFNTDNNKTIDMTSISGSTVHFHSSFFEDKKIPPKGNTSFNVVFLGWTEGFIESSLFIHTSEGFLKYNVKGVSTFSHYRIRPIIGIKLPLNASFSTLIYMHNPYFEPLQILEIYSSGSGFHLELPTGDHEASNDLWEIPSLQTKSIIRVCFEGKYVQNHTAYVRIKLSEPNEILVVPLEIEVSSTMGMYHPHGFVDFGVGGSQDPQKEVPLCLYNPTKRHLRINSVSTGSKAIKVQYSNMRLPPASEVDGDGCIPVGSLTVDWKTAYDTKDFSGKIIVKYRNGKNRSEIPYFLTAIKGGLKYDPLITTYFINDKSVDISSRTFKVKNEYEFAIHISNITIPEDIFSYFKIEAFTPKILNVGEEANLFYIKLKNIQLSELQLHSCIILKTNVSDIEVPLLSYNGKLDVYLPFQSKDQSLNIGLISFDTEKKVYFFIYNQNPVLLHLKSIYSSIPMTDVHIEGCGSEDLAHVLLKISFSNLTKCHNLKPNHYAVIKVVVSTSNLERQVSGHIDIETQFESLKIPVHFKIAPGKLEIGPDRLVFDQCFPAKICSHPLRIHSTFNDPMIIENILTLPMDNRISCKHTEHILPQTSKVVGHLYLNPDLECQTECYTGMIADTSAQWLKTFSLYKFISDFDVHLINIFYNRYLNLTSNGLKNWQNLTLRLDTSEVKGHMFKTRVKMSWPSLIPEQDSENKTIVTFPLTQVGNITYQNITIYNPASYNILVQLALDSSYPNVQTLLNRLPFNLLPKYKQDYPLSGCFFFYNETRQEQQNFFWDMLGIQSHEKSVPILLTPGQSYTVMVGFQADDPGSHSALLLIRNNLTIMEVVQLKADAAFPVFKFGNRRPGSTQPLTFDLTEKHLKDCEKQRLYSNSGLPNLSVKRTFTARNVGDVAIYINSFYINDYPCEGYGFQVVDCEPFVLLPNSTKKIDIAFTPDFTMSRVTRTLILGTSLNIPVNYTLYTTIPTSYLSMCSELIPRPPWEKYLSYLMIVFMLLVFVIVLLIAILDADRIRRQAMSSFIAPNSPSVQPVLDLRLVGQQTKEEIQSVKAEVLPSEEKKVLREDKASQKEFEEEEKPKVETERYTVLIPTIGKTKKKLGKRNSIEAPSPTENEIVEKPEKKKDKFVECKPKAKEKIEKESKMKVEDKERKIEKTNITHKEKEPKKSVFSIRKPTKSIKVPVYEEESSTTDSSCSNYEDPEKENQRIAKVCSKVKLSNIKSESLKPKIAENTNYTSDNKIVSFNNNHYIKVRHHRSTIKTAKTSEKQNKDVEGNAMAKTNEFHHNHHKHNHSREGKKRERGKDREKKSGYHKSKRQNQKASESENAEKRKSPSCFNIPLPPPSTTASLWGENRAKFSDVVARSDSTSTRLLTNSSKQINKPIVYVEPYKQTAPVELGPIGSRRLDRRPSSDNSHRSVSDETHRFIEDHFRSMNDQIEDSGYIQSNNFVRDTNNSFFSDEIRLDNCSKENCYMDQLGTPTGNWAHHNYNNVVESKIITDVSSSMEDPWNQSLLNSSSYWDSYNPLLNESPLLNENSLVQEAPMAQPMVSSQSQSAGYLWGSSSVWQPWAPEVPRTPTRTPPGFDEFLHRKRDEPLQEASENYSPFNSSNLWNQQQNNPWN